MCVPLRIVLHKMFSEHVYDFRLKNSFFRPIFDNVDIHLSEIFTIDFYISQHNLTKISTWCSACFWSYDFFPRSLLVEKVIISSLLGLHIIEMLFHFIDHIKSLINFLHINHILKDTMVSFTNLL